MPVTKDKSDDYDIFFLVQYLIFFYLWNHSLNDERHLL